VASWPTGRRGRRTIGFTCSGGRSCSPSSARRIVDDAAKRAHKSYRAGYVEERAPWNASSPRSRRIAPRTPRSLDIGSLDAALLVASGTRRRCGQQAAGRREGGSLVIPVAQDDPLDQYLVGHPRTCSTNPPKAVIDLTGLHVSSRISPARRTGSR
jgi:DEAD/DEAH box helicase domain-containing protein